MPDDNGLLDWAGSHNFPSVHALFLSMFSNHLEEGEKVHLNTQTAKLVKIESTHKNWRDSKL